jgi:ectoine hydroxylase-related dioxygenase (phytanoyl-CoA dioxygenase family)
LRQVDQKVLGDLQHRFYGMEEVHELWHSSDILKVMEKLIGNEHEIFTHPHKHVRMTFPADSGFKVQQTTPHQDFMYNQGSPEMYSVWAALRDLTPDHGVLEVAEGSHLHGVLGIEKDRVEGSITYAIPEKDIKGDWLTSDFKMGDAIIFHSHTVHRVPPNLTDEIRLSSDCRLQSMVEPISEKWNNLLPGVEEAYPHWKNKELQYYFKKAKLNFKEYDEKNSHILFT